MGKKGYWLLIFLTLAVNVVMLQWTIEAYFGEEYEHVWVYTSVSVVASIVCFIAFLGWRKQEYK
ncbi:hypothetical protein [Bacillus sp. 2205SS5-2]|uniref:hypothetical protein n=1 Tax=Bacillus sp. 2205SS5-2 TaxID=3109031 RepID=UPI00300517A6